MPYSVVEDEIFLSFFLELQLPGLPFETVKKALCPDQLCLLQFLHLEIHRERTKPQTFNLFSNTEWLAQLDGYQTVVREVEGSLRVLKIN